MAMPAHAPVSRSSRISSRPVPSGSSMSLMSRSKAEPLAAARAAVRAGRLDYLVPAKPQDHRQELEGVLLVLDQQDLEGSGRGPPGSLAPRPPTSRRVRGPRAVQVGTWNLSRVRRLSAMRVPPWATAIARPMASPRPRPPCRPRSAGVPLLEGARRCAPAGPARSRSRNPGTRRGAADRRVPLRPGPVARPDRQTPASRREFGRVADQVPTDLEQPCRVRLDVVRGRRKVQLDPQPGRIRLLLAGRQGPPDRVVGVEDLRGQSKAPRPMLATSSRSSMSRAPVPRSAGSSRGLTSWEPHRSRASPRSPGESA